MAPRREHLSRAFCAMLPGRGMPGDLEGMLSALLAKGEQAWPALTVEGTRFVEHVATLIDADEDVGSVLPALHPDLYLACACALGQTAAIELFDRHFLTSVTRYVARVNPSRALADEVEQTLRVKLLAAAPTGQSALIATYRGRAPLSAWLRVVAMRTARSLLRPEARHVTLRTPAGARSGAVDPETALLKARHGAAFDRALRAALTRLPTKDCALLRLYFVEDVSLAAIARMYHVHESTMSRRMATLRRTLIDSVCAELKVAAEDIESLAALVMSNASVHLSALRRP